MTNRLRMVYIHDYRRFDEIPPDQIKDEQHIPASPDELAKILATQRIKLDLPRSRPPVVDKRPIAINRP